MNADTGQMYFTPEEVRAAQVRKEPLVEIDRENIERILNNERPIDRNDERSIDRSAGPVVPLTKGQLRRRMRGMK